MKEKIIIYTNETCPYCKTIKEVLKEKNIEFKEELKKRKNEHKSTSQIRNTRRRGDV